MEPEFWIKSWKEGRTGFNQEKFHRAFLEPEALVRWIAPYGFTCKVHHMDAKVVGTFKMSFTNFGTGASHSFGGNYLELVPHQHQRLRYTDKFDDPNLPGEMQVTVDLKKVSCGTELNIIQGGHTRAYSRGNVLSGLARIPPSACPAC